MRTLSSIAVFSLLSEKDHELHVSYRSLSEAERGWNYTCMLLDITCEEVYIHTQGIIHLEDHVESQDIELEERADMITDLE
jgi:hypothetical protein